MCDYKAGDLVVCVDASGCPELKAGDKYTVIRVVGDGEIYGHDPDFPHIRYYNEGDVAVWVEGGFPFWSKANEACGYRADRFRRIQRLDLSAWLKTAATDTDHLDKPIKTPARPKVDALLKRVQSGAFG